MNGGSVRVSVHIITVKEIHDVEPRDTDSKTICEKEIIDTLIKARSYTDRRFIEWKLKSIPNIYYIL